jgi:hypothetical protein
MPAARWSADELARRAPLEQRVAMAVHLRRHPNLIAWAKERGLFVRVDRATPWGNPFVIDRDGDRAAVIAGYRDDHLPRWPGLLGRLGKLRGKALGAGARRGRATRMCWRRPLRRRAGQRQASSSHKQPLGSGQR